MNLKERRNGPCCAISAAQLSVQHPVGGGEVVESVLVTGSTGVAADTVAYTAKGKVRGVRGAIATEIANNVVTFKLGYDLGDYTTVVDVIHDNR